MIKHLVISGAGPNGLIQCGMLHELMSRDLFKMSNIKSMYCTSAGAFLATFLILSIPIQDVIDYLIERRWDKWIKLDFEFNTSKGFVPSHILRDLILPFFNAYDIPITYTLQDLYDKCPIEFHIFTTELNTMVSVDLNHTSHPTLLLLDALVMTAALPPIFSPVLYQHKYYIDGGLLNNCPLYTLLSTLHEDDYDKVIGINIGKSSIEFNLENFSIMQYFEHILDNCYNILSSNKANRIYESKCTYISYETESGHSPSLWTKFLYNKEYRTELVELGKQCIISHLNK